jgi:hypothetical protein
MRTVVYSILIAAVILGWTVAAEAQAPADVQALLDKMNNGVQLTSDEKFILSDYLDSTYDNAPGQMPRSGETDDGSW